MVPLSSQEAQGIVSNQELTVTEDLCLPAHPIQSYELLDGSGCWWWGSIMGKTWPLTLASHWARGFPSEHQCPQGKNTIISMSQIM